MRNPRVVELLFVTVMLFIGICQSFKCYQCRSDVNAGCSSTMNITWSKDCPSKNSSSSSKKVWCRKIHQKIKFKNEKSWTSIRECAYEKQGPACYRFKWLDLGYQEICECEVENCNGGRSQVPEKLTVALIAFAWIFTYLKASIT